MKSESLQRGSSLKALDTSCINAHKIIKPDLAIYYSHLINHSKRTFIVHNDDVH